ncbi:nucleotide exchange factor GrpE [Candidatus Deianiraea vastatrix]|uniref:Protein GrpE n=1 Tax=Candidatus Deianiraea vastatrix TaxID=2163644 RepID=A0A5B8XD08_9RICK|nr:nucleotide exchange factor GrpE [Candidatus Deianiraea vastatrix]QED23212.1 Protein GrpE [Candidatus Deianiraea vastatrix]
MTEKFTDKILKDRKPEERNETNSNIESEMQALKQENADLKDSLLRAIAETENTRKRLMTDKDNSVKFALTSVIKDLALVLDNLYLSISNINSENLENNPDLKNFYNAINIILIDVSKFLEKNNVKRINPIGEKFDPEKHEAVSQVKVEDENQKGVIINVLSSGYMIHDRIIKPANVIVGF